jgi:endonuclease V-like protein UPF0215 family
MPQKNTEILRAWEFAEVILSSISFAGFNLIDPIVTHEKFKKPVIIISWKNLMTKRLSFIANAF